MGTKISGNVTDPKNAKPTNIKGIAKMICGSQLQSSLNTPSTTAQEVVTFRMEKMLYRIQLRAF